MIDNCKNCNERNIGCHSHCKKYKQYKKQLAELNAKKRKYVENLETRICADYWGYDKRGKNKC